MVLPNHYWTGPIAALVALAVVVLICRWVFAAPPARVRPRPPRGDFGLLVPVATTRTAEDAERVREVLRAAGIRCTVADAEGSGGRQLLVFRSDAARASELVRR